MKWDLIIISHRLEEVFELCDSYTVLRDGKWIASGDIKDVDTDKLIAMMVGRDIKDIYPPIPQIGKDIRLEVKNLGRKDVFQKVSFQVHKGEIFGLAGMVGAGRSEIVETLFGLGRGNHPGWKADKNSICKRCNPKWNRNGNRGQTNLWICRCQINQ